MWILSDLNILNFTRVKSINKSQPGASCHFAKGTSGKSLWSMEQRSYGDSNSTARTIPLPENEPNHPQQSAPWPKKSFQATAYDNCYTNQKDPGLNYTLLICLVIVNDYCHTLRPISLTTLHHAYSAANWRIASWLEYKSIGAPVFRSNGNCSWHSPIPHYNPSTVVQTNITTFAPFCHS